MTILMTAKSPAVFRNYFNKKILLPDNPLIDIRVSHHTDLSLFSFGDTVVCAPFIYDYLSNAIGSTAVICGEQSYSPYPDEIRYNAALVGKRLFCNLRYTSEIVLAEAERRGIKAVNVPQGYSKCSIIPVTDTAMITSDKSVWRSAENEGIEVLLVSNEGVFLPGFSFGFIGGASVCLSDRIVFTGDIFNSHDAGRIVDFIEEHGKRVISFKSEPLVDIGSPAVVF